MQRNQIRAGLTVRVRPTGRGRRFNGHPIGRITSSTTSAKRVGYSGMMATTVKVQWYATLNEDGTLRMWEEPRTDSQFDSRRLEVIDLDALSAELRSWHERREVGRRKEDELRVQVDADMDAVRAALGDETWGRVSFDRRSIVIDHRQLAQLLATLNQDVDIDTLITGQADGISGPEGVVAS